MNCTRVSNNTCVALSCHHAHENHILIIAILCDISYIDLTWEGSSVATMNAREAEFVSAVAASKRGEPFMADDEYKALKAELKKEGSWVVNRGEDALEHMGLNTFMGYLHRSMKT